LRGGEPKLGRRTPVLGRGADVGPQGDRFYGGRAFCFGWQKKKKQKKKKTPKKTARNPGRPNWAERLPGAGVKGGGGGARGGPGGPPHRTMFARWFDGEKNPPAWGFRGGGHGAEKGGGEPRFSTPNQWGGFPDRGSSKIVISLGDPSFGGGGPAMFFPGRFFVGRGGGGERLRGGKGGLQMRFNGNFCRRAGGPRGAPVFGGKNRRCSGNQRNPPRLWGARGPGAGTGSGRGEQFRGAGGPQRSAFRPTGCTEGGFNRPPRGATGVIHFSTLKTKRPEGDKKKNKKHNVIPAGGGGPNGREKGRGWLIGGLRGGMVAQAHGGGEPQKAFPGTLCWGDEELRRGKNTPGPAGQTVLLYRGPTSRFACARPGRRRLIRTRRAGDTLRGRPRRVHPLFYGGPGGDRPGSGPFGFL